MVLVENNVEDAQAGRERKGFGILVGFSYVL
jgi:hypothetical protein